MHTHIELRGREMMKTKKILQAVYFFMCMKVHWWNFQRNPTPNNDITEKKRWCQSPSAAACHQQKPTKAPNCNPQNLPTESTFTQLKRLWKNLWTFSPWKSLRAQITQIKNLWTFLSPGNLWKHNQITQLKKLWTFLSPWIHWKHNQSPNWKNYELCFALLLLGYKD